MPEEAVEPDIEEFMRKIISDLPEEDVREKLLQLVLSLEDGSVLTPAEALKALAEHKKGEQPSRPIDGWPTWEPAPGFPG